jgi:hypothetical protein
MVTHPARPGLVIIKEWDVLKIPMSGDVRTARNFFYSPLAQPRSLWYNNLGK